jgi:hypothetical protein
MVLDFLLFLVELIVPVLVAVVHFKYICYHILHDLIFSRWSLQTQSLPPQSVAVQLCGTVVIFKPYQCTDAAQLWYSRLSNAVMRHSCDLQDWIVQLYGTVVIFKPHPCTDAAQLWSLRLSHAVIRKSRTYFHLFSTYRELIESNPWCYALRIDLNLL